MNQCPLCRSCSSSQKLTDKKGKVYWNCHSCGLLYLDQGQRLDEQKEFEHYQTHNNDVHDPRYQEFVSPIVETINRTFQPSARGLDYGCGPGPVITHLLERKGFDLTLHDPYFLPNEEALQDGQYDFIICSEVAEHFYSPDREFRKLKKLLVSGGMLCVLTSLYSEEKDFNLWYYRQDPTHVVFYTEKTAHWMKEAWGFSKLFFWEKRAFFLST